MKRLWALIVIIFSGVVLLGVRTSYTTSRTTVLRYDGIHLRQNRVAIRYEESKNTHNFHKRAEYHVYLEKHQLYGDIEGRLELFSKVGSDPFGLILNINQDGSTVELLAYANLDDEGGTSFYNKRDCWNFRGSSCSEDEKAMYIEWGRKLWTAWREQMKLADHVADIHDSPPPITSFSKLGFLDFMPPVKRKSVSSKIIVRRQHSGTEFDQTLISYLKNSDGFYYKKMATFILNMKGHKFFDAYQGHLVLFSGNNTEHIYLKINHDNFVVTNDSIHFDTDGVGTFCDQEPHYVKQCNKLWKAWSPRMGLEERVPELLDSPPVELIEPFNFEDFMP